MTKTKDGHEVRCLKVADRTGSVNISLWGKDGQLLEPGDICMARNCFCNLWRQCPTVYIGKSGSIARVGSIMMSFRLDPNMSKPQQEVT